MPKINIDFNIKLFFPPRIDLLSTHPFPPPPLFFPLILENTNRSIEEYRTLLGNPDQTSEIALLDCLGYQTTAEEALDEYLLLEPVILIDNCLQVISCVPSFSAPQSKDRSLLCARMGFTGKLY